MDTVDSYSRDHLSTVKNIKSHLCQLNAGNRSPLYLQSAMSRSLCICIFIVTPCLFLTAVMWIYRDRCSIFEHLSIFLLISLLCSAVVVERTSMCAVKVTSGKSSLTFVFNCVLAEAFSAVLQATQSSLDWCHYWKSVLRLSDGRSGDNAESFWKLSDQPRLLMWKRTN